MTQHPTQCHLQLVADRIHHVRLTCFVCVCVCVCLRSIYGVIGIVRYRIHELMAATAAILLEIYAVTEPVPFRTCRAISVLSLPLSRQYDSFRIGRW